MRHEASEVKTEPALRPLFRKQFRWKFCEGDHAEKTVITPELAAEMMKRNVDDDYRNRPLSAALVRRYARMMENDEWHVTGEAIIFSSDGVLLNGQHRLTACLESGHAFTSWVIYGIDRQSFKFMDQGRKRTAGDIFSIEEVPNAALMAAATVWYLQITRHNGMNLPGAGTEGHVEAAELLNIYYMHSGLQESAWVGHLVASEGESLAAPSMAVALHYLFAQKSRRDADDFMRKVITGVGIETAASAENKIRKWLLKDNLNVGGRTSTSFRAAYLTQAWNARRSGRSVGTFRWRDASSPTAPFPAIR